MMLKSALKKLLNCSDVKAERISYEVYLLKGSEIIHKKFNFVIRNPDNLVVAVGNYLPRKRKPLLENESKLVPPQFPYPIFYVEHKEEENVDIFTLLNYERNYRFEDRSLEALSLKEFVLALKELIPSLKSDSDLNLEALQLRIQSLNGENDKLKLDLNNAKKEIDLTKDYWESRTSELYAEISELKRRMEKYSKIETNRLVSEIKSCSFLNDIIVAKDKIQFPKGISKYADIYYGRNADEKYSIETSRINASFGIYISKLEGSWFLKVEISDYYESGPTDTPVLILSNTLYYKFDDSTKNFILIESRDAENILDWLDYFNAIKL